MNVATQGGHQPPVTLIFVSDRRWRALVGKARPMLKVVESEVAEKSTGGGSLLDELVRDGARQMLAAALQAEVAAYIDGFTDEVDEHGHRLVVRNGSHQERDIATGAGVVTVAAPRVNDKRVDPESGVRQRFSSRILPAWSRKSPKVAEVLPLLYLHGLSSLDLRRRWSSSWARGRACPHRR